MQQNSSIRMSLNNVQVAIYDSDLPPIGPSNSATFKVVVIPSSALSKNPDLNFHNYEQVGRRLQ